MPTRDAGPKTASLVALALLSGCYQPTISIETGEKMIRGQIIARPLQTNPRQKYFFYVPPSVGVGARVLVIIHGASRKAREYIARFRGLGDRYGIVLVAPLFPRNRFRDYQRLGVTGRGERPDLVLHDILAEVGAVTSADVSRIYLFGYSAGAQFVHRYAMAYPDRTAAVAIGAAGWYTFPNPHLPFPHGLKRTPTLTDLDFRPPEFLGIPTAVFIGERDYHRDRWLNKSKVIDRQQGYTRIERATRWIRAMRLAASDYKITPRMELHIMPGVGHSFADAMEQGRMGEHAFHFLFGCPPEEFPWPKEPAQASNRDKAAVGAVWWQHQQE